MSNFQIAVKLTGVKATVDAVEKSSKRLSDKAVSNQSLKLAKVIAEDARGRAPQGPTGNLKRSLRAVILSGDNPPAIAAVDRKVAPHAHLIEFGTSRAPAYPFFRPAVDAHADKLGKGLRGWLKDKVEP